MTDWPKHPDGRPKKMGEMSADEQRRQVEASCRRIQREFDRPGRQAALATWLETPTP